MNDYYKNHEIIIMKIDWDNNEIEPWCDVKYKLLIN